MLAARFDDRQQTANIRSKRGVLAGVAERLISGVHEADDPILLEGQSGQEVLEDGEDHLTVALAGRAMKRFVNDAGGMGRRADRVERHDHPRFVDDLPDTVGRHGFLRVVVEGALPSVYSATGELSSPGKISIIAGSMSLVRFLVALGLGSVLSWAAWVLVVTTLDPFNGGLIVVILFFLSGALAVLGTLTLGGFFLRYWLEKDAVPFVQIATSLRQATTVTMALVVGLLLQAARLLNGWSIAALVVLSLVSELFFLAGQSRRPRSSS